MAVVNFPFDHFHIDSVQEFQAKAGQAGYRIPVSETTDPLRKPVMAYGKELANAMAIQPLEGKDGNEDGSPSPLTLARYEKLAAQGAGILWVEATAVCREGRDSRRQLWLHQGSQEGFSSLVRQIDEAARGAGFPAPYKVLQLTHSGRFSVDAAGCPRPLAAFPNPYLDPLMGEAEIVTDQYLDRLGDQVAEAAGLASRAGFDAVELKLCHGYLMRELLCAFTRPGKYGGSRDNRFRFALETLDKMRGAISSHTDIVVRLNAYDGIPWPYGWGMARDREATSSSWQGNPAFRRGAAGDRTNWAGNPTPMRISREEKSNWAGNPGREAIRGIAPTNWTGNPTPLQVSREEKSNWAGNPGREAIKGIAPANWTGNPSLSAEPGSGRVDLTEVIDLMRRLYDGGVRIFNLTTTDPRFKPTGKGFLDSFSDTAVVDPYQGVTALLQATRELRQAMPPDVRIVGTGLGWFGPFAANVGAGGIREGWFDIAGFGRSVMTDNDFMPSILRGDRPDPTRACMGCDSCFGLFFADLPTGCPVHRQAYKDLFQQALAEGRIK